MATIVPIEDRTVHQIQSGQVIVDLCSVVKELVENGLDAGATSIEVRFKNQGLEAIEVQDNGDGISPHNYESLALKHHTSKLSTYADLNTLQTFGFRGEALSSLCALSKCSVVTCLAQDTPKGTKLDFEQSGKLKGQSVVAAQKGTTVTVESLFHNLPVRKRELERNIKREWNRVVGQLGQYACIQTGIKFSVTQQAGKGKKTTLFSTKGNQTTRENLVNVFGAKTLTALVTLDLKLDLEPTSAPSQRWSTQDDGGKKEVRVVGHVSRPAFGEGRQTPDRQMFFVNARPCQLPQFAKAFNEVYKSYNSHQSPFIFANIELDTHLYDVNVSPDKRTILLHDQTRMLDSLKDALTALFESQDYTVPISQLPAQKQPAFKQLTLSREASTLSNGSAQNGFGRINHRTTVDEDSKDDEQGDEEEEEEEPDSGSDVDGRRRASKNKAVSRKTIANDSGSISLISNWMNGKAQDRGEPVSEAVKSVHQAATAPTTSELSKDKRLLVEKFKKEAAELASKGADGTNSPDSSLATTQSTQETSSFQVPQRVLDFNTRMAELRAVQKASAVPMATADEEQEDATNIQQDAEYRPGEEEPIPSISSPAKPTPSIADRFSIKPRSQRIPQEMATIIIDGETTVSPIGSPAKRIRLEDTPTAKYAKGTPCRITNTSTSSFGKTLSQRFAAPGTFDLNAEPERSRAAPGSEAGDTDDEVEPSASSGDQMMADDAEGAVSAVDHNDHEHGGCHHDAPQLAPENAGALSSQVGDEDDRRQEEALRVAEAIRAAETSAQIQSPENIQRTRVLLRGPKKKESTIDLVRTVNTSPAAIAAQIDFTRNSLEGTSSTSPGTSENEGLESANAEEKLSLTISKSDFAKMRIVGQFNLGFILATRSPDPSTGPNSSPDNLTSLSDLFIIDQHASDEKYNFERLSSTTVLQSQPLVTPKTLDLTALEEELVLEHQETLTKNGFITSFDESGGSPVGQRVKLLALPLSQSTTFNLSDLEELLSLLSEEGSSAAAASRTIRPSKVRKMFAMRACRSSIMIGRTMTKPQMGRLVAKLGELDKPWNCPHGRPTMRHLCGLGVWDDEGWRGDVENEEGDRVDWSAFVRARMEGGAMDDKDGVDEEEEEEESGYADATRDEFYAFAGKDAEEEDENEQDEQNDASDEDDDEMSE